MTELRQLRRCPFCGGKGIPRWGGMAGVPWFAVICEDCGASTQKRERAAEAEDVWDCRIEDEDTRTAPAKGECPECKGSPNGPGRTGGFPLQCSKCNGTGEAPTPEPAKVTGHPFDDKEAVWLALALISDDLGLDTTRPDGIYPAEPMAIYEAFKAEMLKHPAPTPGDRVTCRFCGGDTPAPADGEGKVREAVRAGKEMMRQMLHAWATGRGVDQTEWEAACDKWDAVCEAALAAEEGKP